MDAKLTPKQVVVMPPIFLALLALLLSFAWLVPNHTLPWASFYPDAITASVLLVVAVWVLIRSPGKLELIGLGLFFLFLATVPWLQYATGVIYSFGTAWTNSLYLLGFSLAIFVGWHWERATPGQCLDFLFLAISFAAIVSVGIQVLQWLQLSEDLFVLDTGRSRFYGNLGQPNQLASLLLLAVLGVARAYAKKALGPGVAIILVLFILFGVALTQSRTAWLNIGGILVALFLFWGEGRPKRLGWILAALGVYSVVLNFNLPIINELISGQATSSRELAADPYRQAIWKSLVHAALDRPLFGYGWGQTTAAVFAAVDFPTLGSVTKQSHNIVLDIVIYNGLLLGGLIIAVLASAFWKLLGCLKQEYFIFPALALGLLVVHSMLEFPLHYAYFLLPFGLILGVLLRCGNIKGRWVCSKWFGYGVAISVACGLWLTIKEYVEVEHSYFEIRYGKEWKEISKEFIPQTKVLTQWRDRLQIANLNPEGTQDTEKYRRIERAVVTTPEPFLMFLVAQNLALEGRTLEAREWLEKVCKLQPSRLTVNLAKQWEYASEAHVAYRAVDWKKCPASN